MELHFKYKLIHVMGKSINFLKIIIPFVIISSCSLNGPIFNVEQDCLGCFKGKYRGELTKNNNEILELSKIQFAQLIGELKGMMIANAQLDSLHTIELLRTMNMIEFSKDEYVRELKIEYSVLNEVELLFYKKYFQKIKCQYPHYDGKNGCTDFRTLGINFGGGYYFHCSMLFVENDSGYEKETFLKGIMKLTPTSDNESLIR